MAENLEERRKHVRLVIRAYGFNFPCKLRHQNSDSDAHLIDIAVGGARLKLLDADAETMPKSGDTVHFSLPDTEQNFGLHDVASNVRWTKDAELGIQFLEEPDISLSDLQQVMAP